MANLVRNFRPSPRQPHKLVSLSWGRMIDSRTVLWMVWRSETTSLPRRPRRVVWKKSSYESLMLTRNVCEFITRWITLSTKTNEMKSRWSRPKHRQFARHSNQTIDIRQVTVAAQHQTKASTTYKVQIKTFRPFPRSDLWGQLRDECSSRSDQQDPSQPSCCSRSDNGGQPRDDCCSRSGHPKTIRWGCGSPTSSRGGAGQRCGVVYEAWEGDELERRNRPKMWSCGWVLSRGKARLLGLSSILAPVWLIFTDNSKVYHWIVCGSVSTRWSLELLWPQGWSRLGGGEFRLVCSILAPVARLSWFAVASTWCGFRWSSIGKMLVRWSGWNRMKSRRPIE